LPQMKREMSVFAKTIMNQKKYSHELPDGTLELWPDIAKRVGRKVMKAVDAPRPLGDEIVQLITDMKFIPGGRYLYATGRPFHQTQNCLLLKAQDSREGWAELLQKASMALMTGAGIGVDYSSIRAEGAPIRKTGGFATGPLALMQILNECGRGIMQGGSRRSAIWAGLKWNHPDIHKFIVMKNWSPAVKALKDKDFNFPATMDGTNISVQLDDEFFKAYGNPKNRDHTLAHSVYWAVIKQMLTTAEPGFSVDTGENVNETLRNACQPAWAVVLTPDGIRQIKDISIGSTIWSGSKWTKVTNKWCTGEKPVFGYGTRAGTFYGTEQHNIISNGERVEAQYAETVDTTTGPTPTLSPLDPQDILDGLLIGDGSVHKASGNLVCLVIGAKDQDYFQSEISSMLGRHRPGIDHLWWEVNTTITYQELPRTFNREVPARFKQGNITKVAGFLRGLFSANGTVTGGRVSLKQTSFKLIEDVQQMLSSLGISSYYTINKGKTIEFSNGLYACKESYDLNITTDRVKFFEQIGFIQEYKKEALARLIAAKRPSPARKSSYEVMEVFSLGVQEVFDITVEAEEHTYWTGGLLVSNCTEVTSEDDSDICNLGSINMANINSLEEMQHAVDRATAFLVAGTVYSDIPYSKVDQIRTKNRRLGLGLMGLHEWLLKRGLPYAANDELAKYMEIYATSTDLAGKWADKWSLSRPVKTRAIAPTGTIGIVAETTTGIEPLFCVAYKRRYLKGATWSYQYVIDPTAKRMIDNGASPDSIEDAYSLAENVEKRVQFQAWLQGYVDHSISSTINLPSWGSEFNNVNTMQSFGNMLIKYLPKMRGITCYPDGCRGGQPLTTVKYSTAIKHEGEIFLEAVDICDISKGGSCGS
jgi:ribonucleotide reductase alpha subunit